jgi:predicted metal-binding membrane protein
VNPVGINRVAAWERLVWLYPECWTLGLSVLAWITIVVQTMSTGGVPHAHHDQGGTPWMAHWLMMVVAMMFPLVLDSAHRAAARSLWARRHRAIAGFLAGYLILWLAVGLLASAASGLHLDRWMSSATAAAAGFLVAALWQLTPMKSRAVLSCHLSMPLAPRGWRADFDCFRYGCRIGSGCLVSCWALMLACVLSGHSVFAMGVASLTGFAERYVIRLDQRLVFGALSVVGLAYAAVGLR